MADPITWGQVVAIAAELVDVAPEAQALILAHVEEALNESMFKPNTFVMARILYAAHFTTMTAFSGGSSAAGPVTSETVGGISRSYADLTGGGAITFEGSSYGDELDKLKRRSKGRWPMVVP